MRLRQITEGTDLMSIFGIARGLGVLGLQVWDAASFILRPEKPFFEPRDGAERLAEREAEYEVAEPDCGLGGDFTIPVDDGFPVGYCGDPFSLPGDGAPTPPDTTRYPETNGVNGPLLACDLTGAIQMQTLVSQLTADEITAVRRLLESSATPALRTAVEQAESPEGDPPRPPPSGHLLTLGNDPAATYQRMMRDRQAEDREQ